MENKLVDEVISDEEISNYKIRLKIRKTMKLYWDSLDLAYTTEEELANKMIGNKSIRNTPGTNYNSKQLEEETIKHLTAKNIVSTIDDIIENQLKGLNQLIIDSVYIQEEPKDDTMDRIKNYLRMPKNKEYPKSTYYRHRRKAERIFYLKIIKKLNFF
ncbi:hypothetical protein KHQ81_12910 [Mycoplasmatota bacterium]|nr:hypothetical protein KHQ81_12910 [Mycoplasmatota bacterium]